MCGHGVMPLLTIAAVIAALLLIVGGLAATAMAVAALFLFGSTGFLPFALPGLAALLIGIALGAKSLRMAREIKGS